MIKEFKEWKGYHSNCVSHLHIFYMYLGKGILFYPTPIYFT